MKKFHSLNNYTELSSEQLNQTVGGNWSKIWEKWDNIHKRTTIRSTQKIA